MTKRFFPHLSHTGLLLASLSLALPVFAGHPLITDDTGTQGQGHSQLELNADQTRVREGDVRSRSLVSNATFTHGLDDTLDLAVNLPWQRDSTTGEAVQQGMADVTLQAKWRFWQTEQASLALKPVLTLPNGKEQAGRGSGRSTQSVQLLGQVQNGPWTVLANTGLTHYGNSLDERSGLWNASAALLFSASPRWTLAADTGASRNPDRSGPSTLSYALAGVIYHLNSDIDLDMGYRESLQHGPTERTVGLGLTARW